MCTSGDRRANRSSKSSPLYPWNLRPPTVASHESVNYRCFILKQWHCKCTGNLFHWSVKRKRNNKGVKVRTGNRKKINTSKNCPFLDGGYIWQKCNKKIELFLVLLIYLGFCSVELKSLASPFFRRPHKGQLGSTQISLEMLQIVY